MLARHTCYWHMCPVSVSLTASMAKTDGTCGAQNVLQFHAKWRADVCVSCCPRISVCLVRFNSTRSERILAILRAMASGAMVRHCFGVRTADTCVNALCSDHVMPCACYLFGVTCKNLKARAPFLVACALVSAICHNGDGQFLHPSQRILLGLSC